MLPMIATLEELQQVRQILDAEKAAMGRADDVKLGIMVEIPSAALLSNLLAEKAEFFSVGTNDLTQYTLAMDRGNPNLAKQVDAPHPAVLVVIANQASTSRTEAIGTECSIPPTDDGQRLLSDID